jgi:hypothetical protein
MESGYSIKPPECRKCAKSDLDCRSLAPPWRFASVAQFSRYTHRVAISNRRRIAADAMGITFKNKDYRIQGPVQYKVMTLATDEFTRRFLMHVFPWAYWACTRTFWLSGRYVFSFKSRIGRTRDDWL